MSNHLSLEIFPVGLLIRVHVNTSHEEYIADFESTPDESAIDQALSFARPILVDAEEALDGHPWKRTEDGFLWLKHGGAE